MKIPSAFLSLMLVFVIATPVFADNLHERCPCGPDSIKGPFRLLLMQGHKGADFRDACREHDLCYDTLGCPQGECDELFLSNLLATCDNSKHPKVARFKAKFAYWLVRHVGGNAYRSAQQIAAEKRALVQK